MSSSNENIYSTANMSFQNSTTDRSLKLAECDLQNRQLIEDALVHRAAPIPAQFQQYFYNYLYLHRHQNLRQINYMAQIAFCCISLPIFLLFLTCFPVWPDPGITGHCCHVLLLLPV